MSHDTCRVIMSSSNRASCSASANAAAGLFATSGAPLSGAIPAAHFRINCASSAVRSMAAERGRQIERLRCEAAGRALREHDLVLVDVADRGDARQDRGILSEHVEKDIAREPAGAPRRQIERRGRERQRIARFAESPSTSRPSSSALISAGRNGTEAGMVKTCGGWAAIRRS